MTPEIKSALLKAGNELSGAALEQPGRYLKSLSLLKALSEGELKDNEIEGALQTIRSAFHLVLPAEAYSPQSRDKYVHPLEDQFLENMSSEPTGSRR